jgi:UDP-4-amino-4,6-dideoxy-N-acetyl-beta-L-altrosamine transaminase
MIPYGRQSISQDDIDAVVSVLNSDFLTQGPAVPSFENAVKKIVESKFAIAVNSATSALHLACLSLGVGKGDLVWTSAITFVASANCALYCGASVDFIDIEERTYNLCVNSLEDKLTKAKTAGKLPKVVIPVHLCGQSCDMERIYQLSLKYGFKIIEDASHSIGGRYHDNPIGSCEFSHVSVFSFHPVKIITSAEGGMCTTNDPVLAKKISLLRTHGITRDQRELVNNSEGPWYYEQISLGFNYRMTDLQAALGLSQLDRLEQFISKRNLIADRYIDDFNNSKIIFQKVTENTLSAYHLFVIQIEEIDAARSKKEIFEELREMGINVNLHYMPVYRHPYYQSLNSFKFEDFPNAERYYSTAISIPIFPDLDEKDRLHISNSILSLVS